MFFDPVPTIEIACPDAEINGGVIVCTLPERIVEKPVYVDPGLSARYDLDNFCDDYALKGEIPPVLPKLSDRAHSFTNVPELPNVTGDRLGITEIKLAEASLIYRSYVVELAAYRLFYQTCWTYPQDRAAGQPARP